eukprot:1652453-Pyramimonas_sp.AAC.1
MAETLTRRQIRYIRHGQQCEWLLQQGRSGNTIPPSTWQGSMFNTHGVLTSDPAEILKTAEDFFSGLH